MQIFYLYFCLLFAIVIHAWHSKVGPQVCECKPLLKLSMYHLNNGLVDIFVTKNICFHTECVQSYVRQTVLAQAPKTECSPLLELSTMVCLMLALNLNYS